MRDGNMNEIIRNGVTSMESGARTGPFIGSQYCLLHNPDLGLAGHQATDQIWNLDIQKFIEQVLSRREREVK